MPSEIALHGELPGRSAKWRQRLRCLWTSPDECVENPRLGNRGVDWRHGVFVYRPRAYDGKHHCGSGQSFVRAGMGCWEE